MDVVIPGVHPWNEVLKNPFLWHFAFHSIPELPEKLVCGKEKEYFEFFYNAISKHPERITAQAKDYYIYAYSGSEQLKTGFNWYRGFTEDARYNLNLIKYQENILTPVLYMRGNKSSINIDQYAIGFAKAGLQNLKTKVIPDCGHFISEEQHELFWDSISYFINQLENNEICKKK